jgi:hypothetical protein
MAKKFYAQKDKLGYPIPGTMMSTTGQIPKNCIEIPATAAPTEPHPGNLRYFVRRDAKGNIIPNSLIVSIKKPAGNVFEFTEGAVTTADFLLTETGDSLVAENNDLIIL